MAVLVLGLTLLAAGCGRRGPLEPPPGAALAAPPAAAAEPGAPADRRLRRGSPSRSVEASPTTLATRPGALVETGPGDEADDGDEEEPALTVNPQPTPTARKRTRAYGVPKEPFILDPLL
jgi:predicted small lipoprotein YifL